VPVTALALTAYGSLTVCRATKVLESLAKGTWTWLTQAALANMGTHLFFCSFFAGISPLLIILTGYTFFKMM